MRLAPLPVRRLLRPVAAQRHAAPAPRMAARVVGEQQRAGRPLAGLHLREILRADKARQRFADRQQQSFRRAPAAQGPDLERRAAAVRSEEHTSELQSLMRISYAVFCLKKKKPTTIMHSSHTLE